MKSIREISPKGIAFNDRVLLLNQLIPRHIRARLQSVSIFLLWSTFILARHNAKPTIVIIVAPANKINEYIKLGLYLPHSWQYN